MQLHDAGTRASPESEPSAPALNRRLRVGVDARVELFSILQRLAGSHEYSEPDATPYLAAVDAHFAPFAEHPAVAATRELRAKHGISYNAPLALAVYLDSAWTLEPIRPLEPFPPGLDRRWLEADVPGYLALVRDFSTQSAFRGFFEAQRTYLDAVSEPMAVLLARDDIVGWFDDLFGARADAIYYVVPGLLTGPNSYAATVVQPDGREELYQVLNLQNVDDHGLQHPGVFTGDLLVHEIGHAYLNAIVDANAEALEAAARPAFDRVEDAMRRQNYGRWDLMVKESLVRAATVLYVRDRRGTIAAALELRAQERKSFALTARLVDGLDALRAAASGPVRADDIASMTLQALTGGAR